MKTAVRNPIHRLIAVASMMALFVAIILAVVFLGSAPAQAGTSGPVSKGLITPPAPPPINPPIQTPEPGGAVTVQSGAGSSTAEAVPFRPKLYLTRGQLSALAQGADKPAATGTQSTTKPAGQQPGPQAAYTPPDYSGLVSAQGWNLLLYEDFEAPTIGGTGWILEDFSNDGNERLWDNTDYWSQFGLQSAWPARGGAQGLDPWIYWYPDNMNSWMERQFNFTGLTDVFLGYGLWYDTEATYDWVYFCISTDFQNYSCDYWSGNSGGWLDQSYWLTSYAGYSQVYLAWVFASDSTVSDGYYGPFVDEIQVWGDNSITTPPPPDPNGQLIQNSGFEENPGLNHWNPIASSSLGAAGNQTSARPALSASVEQAGDVGAQFIDVYTDTYAEGSHAAALFNNDTGSDFLYQLVNVPAGVNSVVIDYWFALPTGETTRGRDYFCASLRQNTGQIFDAPILVDLGCLDALDATGNWQESIFALTSSDIAQIANQQVAVLFEMYNTGGPGTDTTLWLDYIRLYATGAGAGTTIDIHEPNNDLADATTGLACGGTMTGTVGDALGGYDVDWFELSGIPPGTLQLDIDAQTKVQDPRSTLDSILRLYDGGGNQIAFNDDDGVTFDSFISTTVPAGTYYASVESFTGAGGPDAYYDLHAACDASAAPPEGGNAQEPPADTWTVMLYLNGEDENFTAILNQYKTGIEGFIGSKQSFLNVVILYDGPNNNDTVRYWVQPNGNYTTGTNRWTTPSEVNMGDPGTLADFVSWAMTAFPAENYYLAIDDHGDGAYGTSWDTQPAPGNQPQLTPPEIYSALKDATQNGARKIDIVDFESCLMGLTENAYDIREWADFVVFSQQISWGINTYPAYFSDLQPADTPLTVGQRIVDRYSAGSLALHRPHTISFVDTSKFAALQTAVSNFGDALVATNNKPLVFQARNASQGFAASNDATNPAFAEYIDLWDFAAQAKARGLAAAQATVVQNAVDDAVVAERHYSGGLVIGSTTYYWNHSRAHGLSIYYPVDNGSSAFGNPGEDANYASYTAPPYLYQMSQDGAWDAFLIWAVPESGARGGGGRPMGASRAALKDFNLSIGTTFVNVSIYLPLIRR